MTTAHKPKADFEQRYQTHLKHLKLKGLQPKTIDAYAQLLEIASAADNFARADWR